MQDEFKNHVNRITRHTGIRKTAKQSIQNFHEIFRRRPILVSDSQHLTITAQFFDLHPPACLSSADASLDVVDQDLQASGLEILIKPIRLTPICTFAYLHTSSFFLISEKREALETYK